MFKADFDKPTWQKLSVKRDRKHEPLVKKLCTNEDGHKPVFTYIKDLMIFAAMVGFSANKRKKLEVDGISIILETYASDHKDSFIYLIALITEKNALALKDENLANSITIFEEYCNAGLEEVQLWLDENPGDYSGIDTLADKVYEQVVKNESSMKAVDDPETLEVEF